MEPEPPEPEEFGVMPKEPEPPGVLYDIVQEEAFELLQVSIHEPEVSTKLSTPFAARETVGSGGREIVTVFVTLCPAAFLQVKV